MPDDRAALDAELKRLHGTGAAAELSALHQRAADMMARPEERRFHLTHAWVYALVSGDEALPARLAEALEDLGGL